MTNNVTSTSSSGNNVNQSSSSVLHQGRTNNGRSVQPTNEHPVTTVFRSHATHPVPIPRIVDARSHRRKNTGSVGANSELTNEKFRNTTVPKSKGGTQNKAASSSEEESIKSMSFEEIFSDDRQPEIERGVKVSAKETLPEEADKTKAPKRSHTGSDMPMLAVSVPIHKRERDHSPTSNSDINMQLHKGSGEVDLPNVAESIQVIKPVLHSTTQTTAKATEKWLSKYPDAVILGAHKEVAATSIKDIFNKDPEGATKAIAEHIGKGYRAKDPQKDSQMDVPRYKQTDDQIAFIRQNLSAEQVTALDKAVKKELEYDKSLTIHYHRNHIQKRDNLKPAATDALAIRHDSNDELALALLPETLDPSAALPMLHNFLTATKDIQKRDAVQQKQLLQHGHYLLRSLDAKKLSPEAEKLRAQALKNVVILEKSLPLAEKGPHDKRNMVGAFAALAGCVTALGVLIGALVNANREIAVEDGGIPADNSETIAEKEATIKENQEKIDALEKEIDELSKLQDQSGALTESQKALAEKQAAVDKLQEQVDQQRIELGARTEEQVKEDAIAQSKAKSMEDKEVITNIRPDGTIDQELSPHALEKAEAAGERAVNEWKAQQAALAEAEAALNGARGDLNALQGNYDELVKKQHHYESAQSVIEGNRAEQSQRQAENQRLGEDINKLKDSSSASMRGTVNTANDTVNTALGAGAIAAGLGTLFFGSQSLKRAVPVMRANRAKHAEQQLITSGGKLVGTIATDTQKTGGNQASTTPTSAR